MARSEESSCTKWDTSSASGNLSDDVCMQQVADMVQQLIDLGSRYACVSFIRFHGILRAVYYRYSKAYDRVFCRSRQLVFPHIVNTDLH